MNISSIICKSKIKEGDQVKIKSDTNLNAEVFSMDLDEGRLEPKSTSDHQMMLL